MKAAMPLLHSHSQFVSVSAQNSGPNQQWKSWHATPNNALKSFGNQRTYTYPHFAHGQQLFVDQRLQHIPQTPMHVPVHRNIEPDDVLPYCRYPPFGYELDEAISHSSGAMIYGYPPSAAGNRNGDGFYDVRHVKGNLTTLIPITTPTLMVC